jgi:hypothetical protein
MKTCSIGGKRHMRLSLFPLLPSTAALSATFSVQAYQRGGLMLVLGAALADQVPFPPRRAPLSLCLPACLCPHAQEGIANEVKYRRIGSRCTRVRVLCVSMSVSVRQHASV